MLSIVDGLVRNLKMESWNLNRVHSVDADGLHILDQRHLTQGGILWNRNGVANVRYASDRSGPANNPLAVEYGFGNVANHKAVNVYFTNTIALKIMA